jgi:CubicO group peptidase (beta-lactamase class C family)
MYSMFSTVVFHLSIETSSIANETIDSIVQQADDYLQTLVDNRTFTGSVLLARNNQIIVLKGYGCSEYQHNEKNTSQTIYRIGSVTKPFTATIVLRLIERKQVHLNDRLSSFCRDYPHGNQITVKHLLSNTSGIEDYTEMEIFDSKCQENLSIDQLIDLFKYEPLKFKPGSQYSYSNSNVRINRKYMICRAILLVSSSFS